MIILITPFMTNALPQIQSKTIYANVFNHNLQCFFLPQTLGHSLNGASLFAKCSMSCASIHKRWAFCASWSALPFKLVWQRGFLFFTVLYDCDSSIFSVFFCTPVTAVFLSTTRERNERHRQHGRAMNSHRHATCWKQELRAPNFIPFSVGECFLPVVAYRVLTHTSHCLRRKACQFEQFVDNWEWYSVGSLTNEAFGLCQFSQRGTENNLCCHSFSAENQ